MNRKARRLKQNRIHTKKFFKTSLFTVGALLATQTVMAPRSFATSPSVFTVTNCEDSGVGSFRTAIENVIATPGSSRILFATDLNCSVISLDSNLPSIDESFNLIDSVEIIGPGAEKLTIDFNDAAINQNLNIGNVENVAVSGLTFKGYGITVSSGELEINGVNMNAIKKDAQVVYVSSGNVIVTNSTFGYSESLGSSILYSIILSSGSIDIDNSTFIGNVFQEGILVSFSSDIDIKISNSTFVDNVNEETTFPSIFRANSSNLSLFGNLFANNDFEVSGTICEGTLVENSVNVYDENYTGCESDSGSNQVITNLRASLAELPALNGGKTPTVALRSGSPAIDYYSDGVYKRSRDQRGFSRPLGSGYDVGAFEYQDDASSGGNTAISCVSKNLGSVGFKPNSDKLSNATKKSLDLYTDSIVKSGCKSVTLNGHTSARVKATKAFSKSREALAHRRALAVENYLKIALKKYDSKVVLKTNALGAKNPISSNKSESGRKLNRRVEIIINY